MTIDWTQIKTAEDKAAEKAERVGTSIRAEAARRLEPLRGNYTDAERETWKGQIVEAERVAAGGESVMIETLAAPRGITSAKMAAVIIAKDAALKAASATVLAAQETLLAMDPMPEDYADDKWWP